MNRIRALLIAEAANPEWVSVPLVGWSIAEALSRVASCHLVTHVRNRAAILRYGLLEGRDFTALDNEYLSRPLWKISQMVRGGEGKGWTTLTAFSSLSYYSFEREVWRNFHERLRSREFDLVHRITPLSPTAQSMIAHKLKRLEIPFVVGPLNGGLPWLQQFATRRHSEQEWLSYLRQAYRILPGYKSTRDDSSAIIVGSRHTLSEMPGRVLAKCVYIPENGIDPRRFNKARERPASIPLRVAFVGRLVPYKGADILIKSLQSYMRDGLVKLSIIGDGPQRKELEDLAANLDVTANLQFVGWVQHIDVQRHLCNSDIMALPSVREFGGGVVLEAMALGVVPIVANYGGPAELVDDDCGIRVNFEDELSLLKGFQHSVGNLIGQPGKIDEMGRRARAYALSRFTWDAKARQIIDVYRMVLNQEVGATARLWDQ